MSQRDKPRAGFAASTMKLHREGAVGFIDWLGVWAGIGLGWKRRQIRPREHNDAKRQQNNRGKRCGHSQRTISNVLTMKHAEPPDRVVADEIE